MCKSRQADANIFNILAFFILSIFGKIIFGQTREEKKIEAIMKAFERLEKQKDRKKDPSSKKHKDDLRTSKDDGEMEDGFDDVRFSKPLHF